MLEIENLIEELETFLEEIYYKAEHDETDWANVFDRVQTIKQLLEV